MIFKARKQYSSTVIFRHCKYFYWLTCYNHHFWEYSFTAGICLQITKEKWIK